MALLLRWLVNALAIMIATQLVSGVHVTSFYAALLVALLLGFLNAVVRPVIVLLTLPMTVVTLGLFLFVINGLLIWFTSSVVKGFQVDGFMPALWLGVFLWIISLLTSWMFEAK